jgi:MFS family permease
MLIGPIIAPLIGGALAVRSSWRATFILLACLTVPITLLTYVGVPETLHWFAQSRVKNAVVAAAATDESYTEKGKEEAIEAENKMAGNDEGDVEIAAVTVSAKTISGNSDGAADGTGTGTGPDNESDTVPPPVPMMPWTLLKFLFDGDLIPYYTAVALTFAP